MSVARQELSSRYRCALQKCLQAGDESALLQAYEPGRWAIDNRLGLLEFVDSNVMKCCRS